MPFDESNVTDVCPNLDAAEIEYWNSLPSGEKFQILNDLIIYGREKIEEQLRACYPNATSEEIFRRRATVLLGAELAAKVYGPEPDPPTANIPMKTLWYVPSGKSR